MVSAIRIAKHNCVSILNPIPRDLKKMTDVSNVEMMTEVSQAEVKTTVAIVDN